MDDVDNGGIFFAETSDNALEVGRSVGGSEVVTGDVAAEENKLVVIDGEDVDEVAAKFIFREEDEFGRILTFDRAEVAEDFAELDEASDGFVVGVESAPFGGKFTGLFDSGFEGVNGDRFVEKVSGADAEGFSDKISFFLRRNNNGGKAATFFAKPVEEFHAGLDGHEIIGNDAVKGMNAVFGKNVLGIDDTAGRETFIAEAFDKRGVILKCNRVVFDNKNALFFLFRFVRFVH